VYPVSASEAVDGVTISLVFAPILGANAVITKDAASAISDTPPAPSLTLGAYPVAVIVAELGSANVFVAGGLISTEPLGAYPVAVSVAVEVDRFTPAW
jgi:hypothetical protein